VRLKPWNITQAEQMAKRGKKPATASSTARAEQRRTEVARLVGQEGYTLREAAKALGVGLGTVHRDMQACRATWASEQAQHIDSTVREELAKLDRVEASMMNLATGSPRANTRIKATLAVVRVQERRAKLLGHDAPAKVENVTKNPFQELVKQLAAEELAGDNPAPTNPSNAKGATW
jgi:hypothetical protein